MKSFKMFALALASLFAVACNSDPGKTTTVTVEKKCQVSSECKGCPADFDAKCVDGQCQCRQTETVTVAQPSCETKADCTCPEGSTTTCVNAQCTCTITKTAAKASCEEASDCAPCAPGFEQSCLDQQCYCYRSETVTLPSCEDAADCNCPADHEATCLDSQCICTATETITEPSCTSTNDCTCPGGYSRSCISHQCYCSRSETVTVTEPSCTSVTDCACPADYAASCQGEQCYCQQVVTVEVPSCTSTSDCACPVDYTASCITEQCYCYKTVEVPSCTKTADCSTCPAGFTASCQNEQCYCQKTVTVELPSCTDVADCTCPTDYTASCQSEVCYCQNQPEIYVTVEDINWDHPVVVAGTSEVLAVRYRVYGTSATNPFTATQVINQPGGEGAYAVATQAIAQVQVSCSPPSGVGNYIGTSSSMPNGIAQFTGLNCYDESGNGLEIAISYTVNTMAVVGDQLSGQTFRIVMYDDRIVGTQIYVPVITVRRTLVEFANVASSSALLNGERVVYTFQATANSAGSVGLARLAFEVQKHDDDGDGILDLNNFRFYKGSTLVTGVRIFDTNGNDIATDAFLEGSEVIVSFDQEQIVSSGATQVFSLRAEASGVETGDMITSFLRWDDELPITGKTANTTPNTARLIGSSLSSGLFTSLVAFRSASSSPNMNIIMSDLSASGHVYSTAVDASSYDWTNGYGLDVHWMDAVELNAN